MQTLRDTLGMEGMDIEVGSLRPLTERTVNFEKHPGYRKIVASIRSVGLIEPLSVFLEEGQYTILDGYLRYMACKELGMTTMPCLLLKEKQAYSFNRNVNRLSGSQEDRMLKRSLETIDEETIAATFGLKTIKARLAPAVAKLLHKDIVKAFGADIVGRQTCREMRAVTPDRQVAILAEMTKIRDFSPAFCRSLVIRSRAEEKIRTHRERKIWAEDSERKKGLVDRLSQAEKQQEFYANLYRQYSTDLMKITFYVRKLLMNRTVDAHLKVNYPAVRDRFRSVVFESGAADE